MAALKPTRVLVTGARGFIGKNLVVRLGELPAMQVLEFTRANRIEDLASLVAQSDAVIHLAGENRPVDPDEFSRVNAELTRALCDAIRASGRRIPIVLASSIQAERDGLYGASKRAAERIVETHVNETGGAAIIYRLPGVFGKWCTPNYNSVVATFCHNIARGEPIQINDAASSLRLVYVDDVVDTFIGVLQSFSVGFSWGRVEPEYAITLGELAEQIRLFRNCRTTLITERVGSGLKRALYSTYISYLPADDFAYDLPQHGDDRGNFIEVLKTPDCGQFSFFTVRPGVTRGSHYHHSKTEKFVIVRGLARMRFRKLVTGETYEVTVSAERPQVVDTIPGWVHDITNIGDSDAVIMLWANEMFDRERPDSISCKV